MKHLLLIALAACAATFDAPPTTTPAVLGAPGARVVTIVRIPAPWYAPRFVIRRKFAALAADYEHVPGLARKLFTISDDRELGGVYEWRSAADAATYFSPAWHAHVRDRYGTDTDVLTLAAPFVVSGTTTIDAEPIDRRCASLRDAARYGGAGPCDRAASKYPARASLLLLPSERGEIGLRALADAHGVPPGLVSAYFVTAPGQIGVVAVWADDELARASLDRGHLEAYERAAGAPAGSARLVGFDAPVQVDNSARDKEHGQVEDGVGVDRVR
jgi:hypothetical protein